MAFLIIEVLQAVLENHKIIPVSKTTTVDFLKKATAVAKLRASQSIIMCKSCTNISNLLHPSPNAEAVPAAVTAALGAILSALDSAPGPAAATAAGNEVSKKTLKNRERRAKKAEKRREAKVKEENDYDLID
ncbi:uncharacterized protein LDX57_002377 [Aspergillus melleus]|uniref:uncharacterized protein n=1 Tax=Aspergillus melleus TaxID=138277 RepID=UPI001E8E0A0D|nr:uncharacterized protein LDX57_002377 [Aspergillus melleus]KAH8424632.1 hypothetical protein LDX57_002377 [Aspergillus melleus]